MRKTTTNKKNNPDKPPKGFDPEQKPDKSNILYEKYVERAKKGAATRQKNKSIYARWTANLKKAKISPGDSKLKQARIRLNISQREMAYYLWKKGEKIATPNEELWETGESQPQFYKRAMPKTPYARIEQNKSYVSPARAEKIVEILNAIGEKTNPGKWRPFILKDLFYIPESIQKVAKHKPSKLKYMAL